MLYNPDETMKGSLAPLKMFFTAAETIALEDTAKPLESNAQRRSVTKNLTELTEYDCGREKFVTSVH